MSESCPDCKGKGYTLSDPDGKQLVCWTCGGNMDNAMEEMGDRLGADAEDAEEGRQERLREKTDSVTFTGMDEAAKAMREKLESIFGQDDPDEAGPGERRTGREIKEIAAMILHEEGGRK